MKIEIITTKSPGIVQCTTLDERWYSSEVAEVSEYRPSSTWIAGCYPKGVQFYKWLAEKGWDEAEAIKIAAGEKGSKVHKACEQLMSGEKVKMDDKFVNPRTEQPEELMVAEWECIMSFASWWNQFVEEHTVEILAIEQVIFPDGLPYAGTLDYLLKVDKKLVVLDLKTSQNVWTEHELQISSYAVPSNADLAWILQIGYKRNKVGWKLTEFSKEEIATNFTTFMSVAYEIWKKENPDAKPKQRDYPTELKLTIPPKVVDKVRGEKK